jgi:hypothetical protein
MSSTLINYLNCIIHLNKVPNIDQGGRFQPTWVGTSYHVAKLRFAPSLHGVTYIPQDRDFTQILLERTSFR